ncbi:MAG: hypothetical protein AAGA43_00770 [Bacteroidota bacterium]
MKLFLLFASLFLFSVQYASGQLTTLGNLPLSIDESSGIENGENYTIWTFNDSGGRQELYQCDTTGKLVRTLKIKNAANDDWEDITQDDEGHFYIGNFGNNSNKRKELSLFKIKIPQQQNESIDFVSAEKISFRFEDQTEFPPPKNQMNFDCEAVFWFNKRLYLFTKHRTLPMKTNLYSIPDKPGNHIAKKIGSFATGVAKPGEHPWFGYWVTAADISPDKNKVALISGTTLWIFYDFENDNFLKGKVKTISLERNTQKEAVCFANDTTIYITDEYIRSSGSGGKLYKIDLSTYFGD